MKTKKLNLKSIVLSLALAAGMLLPVGTSAQETAERPGGLFGSKDWFDDGALFTKDGEIPIEGENFTNGNFGEEEAPLSSGIGILLTAGLGYVALKKKEDKQ